MDIFARGKVGLKALVDARAADPESDLNEATTRLRIIDTLLMDCLGWKSAEIDAEKYHDGDYRDYALGKPASQAILEAKREGIYFELPAGLAGRRSIDLSTIMESDSARRAIEQVLGYCQASGVPVAAVCNGHQLIAFYASRQDGVPPLNGRALIFSSLDEMLGDFNTLWNHLSPAGLAARNLQRALLGANAAPMPPAKLSDSIVGYPGFRSRSSLETDLKILGGLFIQDLETGSAISDNFLRECYTKSGAMSQYALVSKEILKTRYRAVASAADVEAVPVRSRRGVSEQLTADIIAAAMSRRPLVLLGDVGVGKSIFLRHLIRVDAADVLESSVVFYIDFGNGPALETSLEEYVYRRLEHQLLEEHHIDIREDGFVRAVYNAEINRFQRGIYGTLRTADESAYRIKEIERLAELTAVSSAHLHRSLEHLRATSRRPTTIVLDNVDQRPPEFQDRVFLIAQALAETWPATVFVALRPSTFFKSRATGSLAAYQPRVFTVSPTRVDEVVLKRIAFAQRLLDGSTRSDVFPRDLSLNAPDLVSYLRVLEKAFRESTELNSLLENLSGGNLRLAMTMLASFVGSPYVNTQRILETAETGGVYTVPMHEVLRAVIYGDYRYFDPAASEVANLFDISQADGREHFLLPLLLAFAQRQGEAAGRDGFVEASTVFDFGQSLGFIQEQVSAQVQRALSKRLLEAIDDRGAAGPYRVTTVGSYMYRSMLRQHSYVDAMVVDTPIVEVAYRSRILDAESILDRVDRVKLFREYLDEMWVSVATPEGEAYFSWPPHSIALGQEAERITATVARRAASRSAGDVSRP